MILSAGTTAPIVGAILAGAGTGFLFSAGLNIVDQRISMNDAIDPMQVLTVGGIGAAIGAVSGFASGYIGFAFELSGQLFGYSLGTTTARGVNVGKAFALFGGTKMQTKIFAFFGKTIGAFIGGAIANEYANQWFGENPTDEENIYESLNGMFWDNIFGGIYKFFKWIKAK